MTGPGPRPPRGRHAAPDDDVRPEEAGPGGRHAAGDPSGRRDPEVPGLTEPPRRRHAAPDDSPTGVTYHRPSLSNGAPYRRPGPNGQAPPAGYPSPTSNGYRPSGGAEAYPGPSADTTGRRPEGYSGPGEPDRPDRSPDGYASFGYHRPNPPGADPGFGYTRPEPEAAGSGYRRPAPSADDHRPPGPGADHSAVGYRLPEAGPHNPAVGYRPPGAGPDNPGLGYRPPEAGPHNPAVGYRPPGAGPDNAGLGYRPPGAGPDNAGLEYRPPGAGPDNGGLRYRPPETGPGDSGFGSGPSDPTGGFGYGASEPGVGEPGFGYHRPEPGAHRYGGTEAAPRPWTGTNGYHLETPGPPGVNGYRLDEPVAPVNGFPYAAPPSAPIAYPVNGHGVDAAERDAASWPARGNTVWPVDARGSDLDQPLDPRIARMPLDDGPTEILDRPKLQPATTPRKPPHPPRAVVRRRRARRKALEWPFLIVFALVSAFLIRQYVVQTFYIPSASMHETLIEGDRVLVNKVGYHLHDIHRGDVVVFRKPPNLNVNEDDLIKRVIGLPGETVEGRDGKVYINGAPLQEPYVEPLCHGTGEFPKVTVPAGKLWVMGDNRCNSSDSRVFGPIDQHLVVGRAFVLVWPLDRLAWL